MILDSVLDHNLELIDFCCPPQSFFFESIFGCDYQHHMSLIARPAMELDMAKDLFPGTGTESARFGLGNPS